MIIPKSYLFVPATRLDRVQKAFDSGANAVIIDLEDATAGADRVLLRDELQAFLQTWNFGAYGELWLRINGANTSDCTQDLALVNECAGLSGVFLPKVESKADVLKVVAQTDKPIIAMLESAKGVLNIGEIASVDGLRALSYGCLDLLYSLGVMPNTDGATLLLNRVRTDLLLYSALYGLSAPIETIFTNFHDEVGLTNHVKAWQALGFGGQLLIHPKQVAVMNRALVIDDKTRQFAQKIYDTYHATGQAVFSVDGQMVDMPLILWAKGILGVL